MTTHRVRMFIDRIEAPNLYSVYNHDSTTPSERDGILDSFKRFSRTREAAWCNQQDDIRLDHATDNLTFAYALQIVIYADLTDRQYTDYVLRGLYIG
jgi:hypothetical protein